MERSRWGDFIRSHKSRAKTFGLTRNFTEAEWISLLENSAQVCACCKKPFSEIVISADHVVPLACGGTNTIDNIQILCRDCNSKKSVKAIDYRGIEPVVLNVKTLKQAGRPKSTNPKELIPCSAPKPLYQFFKELAAKNERSSINYEIILAMMERKERLEKEKQEQSPDTPA